MTRMHNFFFFQSTISANSAPQLILKILLVVNHSVNLISYTMLQKMLTPKPTPVKLTARRDWRWKESCSSGEAVNKIMWYEIAETGRSVTPQPDLNGQWHLFSYTQRHYPILPCEFQAPGRLSCLKQSDRVKSFPCAELGQLAGELVGDSRLYH